MKSGRVSQTALKVALVVVALAEDERWAARLPEGMASLTERLLVAADVPLYRGGMIRFMKGRLSQWIIHGSRKNRATYGSVGARKLFMNRQVVAAVEAGATQVLVLGAGFDTLCLRLAPRFSDVRWFEIDHPATSAAKVAGVTEVGKPDNMLQIAVDLGQTRLSTVLAEQARWDPRARTIVVAEGLLMYLTPEQIQALFEEVRISTGPGTRLAFSHLLDLDAQGAWARIGLRIIGEPWLSSYASEALPGAMRELGWRVMEQERPEGSSPLEGFAVVEPGDPPDEAADEG